MRRGFFGSLVGAFFGLILFLLAFGVIWWNEGKTNLADVARNSAPASAEQIDAANEGKLVAVTGSLGAGKPLADADFVEPGDYLALERVAEMYAWQESSASEGEGETRKEYKRDWSDSPADSSKFVNATDHFNPPMQVKGSEFFADGAQIGSFTVDLANLSLPRKERTPFNNLQLSDNLQGTVKDDFFYLAPAKPDDPKVGDIRIYYNTLASPLNVTLFAQQNGSNLISFPYDKGRNTFYRAITGDRNQAIATLETENTIFTWAMRVGSFLMMWFGLGIVFSPLVNLLGILPGLRQVGRFITSVVTFAITLVVWLVATAVAIVLQNVWLLIALVVVLVGGGYVWVTRRKKAIVVR